MLTADFDFSLPPQFIAQTPARPRDQARLLVFPRQSPYSLEHRTFGALLEYLKPKDVLVLNNSRVIPARLWCRKAPTGARIEVVLFEENGPNDWWALLRPAKRLHDGVRLEVLDQVGQLSSYTARLLEKNSAGHGRLLFRGPHDIRDALEMLGHVPLPPYIERPQNFEEANDRERYQTVYAQEPGSIAAPTAGLHFTPELLDKLINHGVSVTSLTLHIGLGTFTPVKAVTPEAHEMHREVFSIPEVAASAIDEAKAAGGRVVAVGTSVLRALETRATAKGRSVTPGPGWTNLFIYPPYTFRVADALVTNFHLPRSSLLMLVSAFASPGLVTGREALLKAYSEAIEHGYRFFSYGDAMFLF